MMRTWGVLIVACVGYVAPADAQAPPSATPPAPYPYAPAPYPYAPPKPVKPPDDGPREPRYRSVLGVGISGTLKPDWDQRFTLATELERNIRTSDRFSIGWNIHWSFRNWGVVKAVYSQIDETTDNKSKTYGYALGWISGTSMLGGGWQVKYASTAETKGWALVGTRLVLFLDPTESEEGDEVDASWSHALHGGVGYDFGKAGFGLRAMWAPDAALFGSTDSAPLLLVMGTIEVLKD